MLDSVMGYVMDGVCDRVCDGQRLSQAEGVMEVWLFGEDSFKECPLTQSSMVTKPEDRNFSIPVRPTYASPQTHSLPTRSKSHGPYPT